MDGLITAVRFPIGILVMVTVTVLGIGFFALETVAAFVSLLFLAVTSGRNDIKQSWLRGYPNTVPWIPRNCAKVWFWIFTDDAPTSDGSPPAGCLVITIVVLAILGALAALGVVPE